ncbi:flagellar filament capping protein FliD [Paenibacillus sp. PL2-23]|uniref:flagellar filament capping protein FliD n=1 Tax=Paenibacillus sp. PL2-23 TaxID=2100729 RepID=UPI0030F92B35
MRISGLASGLDVDAMVKELMKARRTSYDTMIKKRGQVEWKREDYRAISTKIVDFRNNKLSTFNLSNAISAKMSQVTGDTLALKVNSTSSTAAGSMIVKVEQLALSQTNVYNFGVSSGTAQLDTLGFTEDPENTSNIAFTINGEKISVSKTATLSDLASVINASSSKSKAMALYNADTGQFSLAATETGENKLAMTESVFIPNGSNARYDSVASVAGGKARVNINGVTYEQDSNRFSVNGVDFTAQAISATGATISVIKDTSKIVETVKNFVTEYNQLISVINGELSEEKNRAFLPLTSDEKASLSDKEVEQWEAKARSGALRNDATLSKYVSDLRSIATTLIAGVGNGTVSVGITTGSYSEKGKLVLDEEQLSKALDSHSDETISLFADGTNGIFKKMMDTSMTALTDLSKIAGTSLTSSDSATAFLEGSLIGEQLRSMKDKETMVLARLNKLETQYYKQFSAMEAAINKMNSQSSSLSSFA